MEFLNQTFERPEANLACDEALLDTGDVNPDWECLRIWESATAFVVLGYGNRAGREVNLEACRTDGIPVLRRCTGGGTVLQGPGCVNYTLILQLKRRPQLQGVTGANRWIMEQQRNLARRLTGKACEVHGCTDLVIGQRKFSGNAQRRRKQCLLFHGTFLLDYDPDAMTRYLVQPSRQPTYRMDRAHADFLTTLPCSRQDLIRALQEHWNAATTAHRDWEPAIETLVTKAYGTRAWNERL